MHQRRVIREAIQAILQGDTRVTSIVPAADIHTNLFRPLPDEKLPAIIIYANNEGSDHRETAPRELKRQVRIMIELQATSKVRGTDDFLDDLADEVEQVLFEDVTLNDTADDSWLFSSEFGSGGESRTEIGALVLGFMVEYYTQAPRLVPSDIFDTLESKIKDPVSEEIIGENLDIGINQE